MAKQTDINLRSTVFYQVFPRQHSKTHDFQGLIQDLDRIRFMGVDVLYLLPIHPIGEVLRKGKTGSPYSIKDYYQIDPAYGTMDDFHQLIEEARKRKMKVMMDIVINHTARDSVLTKEHPNWFYRKPDGSLANRVGDWSDITDLDYRILDIRHYMLDMLAFWAAKVDGFRCDVAPMLPIDFWLEARNRIQHINPNFIWLSESVHPGFIRYLRGLGYDCHSDSEMFQAFDICYDYDIYEAMDDYLQDGSKLSLWLEAIERQESIYPKNYVKLRSFENHDQRRLRSKVRDDKHFETMVALSYFLKGPMFIYAGMEHQVEQTPSLFEKDLIPWNQARSIESLIRKLSDIKHRSIFTYGHFEIHHKDQVAVLSYTFEQTFLVGLFNLEPTSQINVPLKDGTYTDIYSNRTHIVKEGRLTLTDTPIWIETEKGNRR